MAIGDMIQSYPGENEVDQTETERCDQGIALTGTCVPEHG